MPQKTRIILSGDTIVFITDKSGSSFDELVQVGVHEDLIRFTVAPEQYGQVGLSRFVKAGSTYPDPPSAGQAWEEWMVITGWLGAPQSNVPANTGIEYWDGAAWQTFSLSTHATNTKTGTTLT